MIITCPLCLTKFKLAEERIPAGGAKARCSKCKHVFFITKETSSKLAELAPELPAVEALPKISPEPAHKVKRPLLPKSFSLKFIGNLLFILFLFGGAAYGLGKLLQNPFFKEKADYHYSVLKSYLGFKKSSQGFISLEKVKGYYLENKYLHRIFVVEGEAVNHWNEPRSFIKVKGTLLDAQGERVEEKTSYCGNILLEEDLKKFPSEAINKSLSSQFGETFSNVNIPPGKAVPFMIVFTDFYGGEREGKKISDFQVEVVSSQKGS